MCGRLNVTDHPLVIGLLEGLGMPLWPSALRTGRFIRATNTISIVLEQQGQRRLDTWGHHIRPDPFDFSLLVSIFANKVASRS
jgi:hypothetical protein